jgi:hypothetical protein
MGKIDENKTILIALHIKDFKQYLWSGVPIIVKCVLFTIPMPVTKNRVGFCSFLDATISEEYYFAGFDAV